MPVLESRRRGARIPLRIPLVISGMNFQHETFNEHTETVDVGKFGAKVLTKQRLRMGSLVSVRRANSEQTESFRVVYIGDPNPDTRKFPVGLEVTSIEDFWGQSFPPDAWQ